MKTRLKQSVVTLSLLLFFSLGAPAETKDISGRWTAPFNREGKAVTIVMNLVVSGQRVTGTITHARGDVMQIQNGKLEGKKLAFDATDDDKDTYHYTGDASEDVIKLQIEYNGQPEGPVLNFRRSEK